MTRDTGTTLGWRSAFAVTLTMAMGIGPLAVHAVSALAPAVVQDLALSRTQLGSLATVTFGVAGACSIIAGRQVDAFGGRVTLFWVFASGGAAALVIAGAGSLPWMWVGAVLGGTGLALANPVTNALIARHVPSGRRGTYIGLKQSGVPFVIALIGFVLPPASLVIGWRGAIALGVVLGITGVAAVWFVIPSSGPRVRPAEGAVQPPSDPVVLWLAAYAFFTGIVIQGVIVYAPLYSYQVVGLPAAVAGMTTGVVGASGMVGRILWSRLAERWDAPMLALTSLAAVALVSVLLVMGSQQVGAIALWPGLVGFGLSAVASNAVVMLAVIRTAGSGRTGRASGTVGLGLFLGFMVGPVSFGAVVDASGSYALGWSLTALMALLAMSVGLVWRHRSSLD